MKIIVHEKTRPWLLSDNEYAINMIQIRWNLLNCCLLPIILPEISERKSFWKRQTQPSRGVLTKSCSESINYRTHYKFTEHPCQSVISIKWLCNFIEIILRHGCSSVTLLDIFITPFPKNTSVGLLLKRALDFYQSYTILQWMHYQDLSN